MPIEAGKLALETIRLFLLAQEQSVEIDNSNLTSTACSHRLIAAEQMVIS